MNNYMGHPHQVYGVEEMRLCGGKADGMRMLYVRNGKGLEFWVSADRCADIARLSLSGVNFSYFSPCGYVAPAYYDDKGAGFLKSFTAGFFTTCGLGAVGQPCVDEGESLPLHGTIGNTPCENIGHWIADGAIHIRATVRDAAIFAHQLLLEREYIVSLESNRVTLRDTVINIGSTNAPLEILYHCNLGYPLLTEKSVLSIPSVKVDTRNEHAASGVDRWMEVEVPQRGYREMCFYHTLPKGETELSLYNPELRKGVKLCYNTAELPFFTQWKMMGEHDYVMGLEPGNCTPDGRNVMRQKGLLDILEPGQTRNYHINFEFTEE